MKSSFLLLFLSISILTYSEDSVLKKLAVGDTMINISLGQVYNKNIKEKYIEDFKGKLLILDFWTNTCKSCIEAFPSMEAIQNKFGDKIQILGIGLDYKNSGAIYEFMNKRNLTKLKMQLPTIIRDMDNDTLNALFDIKFLPVHVWISPEGIILGVTSYNAVSMKNVQEILNGKTLDFGILSKRGFLKKDESLLFNSGFTKDVYGSGLTGYRDSLSSFSLRIDTSELNTKISVLNSSVEELFRIANDYRFGINEPFSAVAKRIILDKEIKGFIPFQFYSSMDYWGRTKYRKENLFCYESVMPKWITLNSAKIKMHQDLENILNVSVVIDSAYVDCLALVKIIGYEKFIPTTNINEPNQYGFVNSVNYRYSGIDISYLVSILNSRTPREPLIIDETGINSLLDITLPLSKNKITELKQQLEKYGLRLISVKRKMPVMKISSRSKESIVVN